MEIKLSMKILQVAMTVDEARQNGLPFDINHLCIGRNSDFAATTDCLEPACLDNDDGILDRRPAGAIDQFSTLHHKYFLCHVFFSSLLPISRLRGISVPPLYILGRFSTVSMVTPRTSLNLLHDLISISQLKIF